MYSGRYSLKLMYDRVILACDEDQTIEDVLHDLEEFENVDNYIGIMNSLDWCHHIKHGTKQLFTVYFDKNLVNISLYLYICVKLKCILEFYVF